MTVKGITVDGNDVQAVYAASREAAAEVRATKKPILLETYTYRTWGHYEPDDQAYVDRKELTEWRERDPIEHLKNRLLAHRQIDRREIDAIEARVKERIADALTFASESPFPAATELATDVYA